VKHRCYEHLQPKLPASATASRPLPPSVPKGGWMRLQSRAATSANSAVEQVMTPVPYLDGGCMLRLLFLRLSSFPSAARARGLGLSTERSQHRHRRGGRLPPRGPSRPACARGLRPPIAQPRVRLAVIVCLGILFAPHQLHVWRQSQQLQRPKPPQGSTPCCPIGPAAA
jgi:hypothetical protein